MNALLEKLFAEEGYSAESQKIVNEIQEASENDPAAWYPELEAAYEQACGLSNAAHDEFRDASTDVAVCEAHSAGQIPDEYDAETKSKFLIEAKARAWDLYWELKNAEWLRGTLYEQMTNAGYILELTKTPEGKAEYEKRKVEWASAVSVSDDEFPF